MEKGSDSGSSSGSGTAHAENKNMIRALIVDDSPVERMIHGTILKRVLEIEGYQEAENGKEAVDLHKTGTGQEVKHKFDLILMDSQMPIMNGIQATKTLREMGISCIIIGVSWENEKQRFKEAGANSFVRKPLNVSDLRPILEEYKLI